MKTNYSATLGISATRKPGLAPPCRAWRGGAPTPAAGSRRRAAVVLGLGLGVLGWIGLASPASGQLFTNLTAYSSRWPVGDPSIRATNSPDGPKGIATADFNGDGRPDLAVANTDGTVTVYYGVGQGKFGPPLHLQTGVQELRGILADDMNGDGRPDVTVAAP